jgi:uncharacterized phage-associated protein
MFRQFDTHKAIQAAGVLLRFEKNRMSYLRLLKLLYIADREFIRDSGLPLLGSRAVAMEHGPLHSDVYNLVKGIHENTSLWSRFFRQADTRWKLSSSRTMAFFRNTKLKVSRRYQRSMPPSRTGKFAIK